MPDPVSRIVVRGAKQNNLKGIDLEITPGELTVFTGLSGSGKTTLLFDVIHAEGQRKYVETFSPYVRQFLDTLPRPKVDSILNARPSISVEQKNTVKNSRSTVGTMTEICDYFKVWFPNVAELFDPESGEIIDSESLGGGEIHTKISGVADYLAENDEHALTLARQCIKNLNSNNKISRNISSFEEPL